MPALRVGRVLRGEGGGVAFSGWVNAEPSSVLDC